MYLKEERFEMVFKYLKKRLDNLNESKLKNELIYSKNVLSMAQNFKELINENDLFDLATKKDEEVIMILNGVVLLEMKVMPGSYEGGSTGVSFRLTDRISVRSSKFAGKFIPGPEIQAVVDSGKFIITSHRGMFLGKSKSREFLWSKLLGYKIHPVTGGFGLYLPVSNRDKVSAIGIGKIPGKPAIPWIDQINQRMALALAIYKGAKKEFIKSIENQIEDLEEKLKMKKIR